MGNIDFRKVGGVVAVLIFIIVVLLYNMGYLNQFIKSDVNNTNNTNSSSNNSSSTVTTTQLQEVRNIDNGSMVGIEAPPSPVNGKVRSISMVGPSGIYNSIVLTDGRNFKLLKKAFSPKLINEQFVSSDDVKSILENYVRDSWNNGIKSNGDIQIVIASSVINNPKIQSMIPELKKTYVVTTTTSETEGSAAFKVAVNPMYQNTAFVMDVTPTIIRFSYNNNGIVKTIVAKTGSKYYQNNQTDDQALAEIRQAVSQIPRNNQQLCLVLWAAAEKDLRQGDNRYSAIPNYTGNEKSTQTGLKLVNEVKNLTNANMVLDFESMWFSGF